MGIFFPLTSYSSREEKLTSYLVWGQLQRQDRNQKTRCESYLTGERCLWEEERKRGSRVGFFDHVERRVGS